MKTTYKLVRKWDLLELHLVDTSRGGGGQHSCRSSEECALHCRFNVALRVILTLQSPAVREIYGVESWSRGVVDGNVVMGLWMMEVRSWERPRRSRQQAVAEAQAVPC